MTTATITVTLDGTAVIDLDGQPSFQLHADNQAAARQRAVAAIIDHAHRTGQPVRLLARDDTAEHLLDVHPDGTVQPAEATPTAQRHPAGPTGHPGLPAAPPARRRWPIVAAATATLGLAIGTALWVRPTTSGSASTTAETAPTAQTAQTASEAPRAGAALETDTLGVTAAARSAAPRPLRLPGARPRAQWVAAASWQSRQARKQAAAESAAAWTTTPSTATWTAPSSPGGAASPPDAAAATQPATGNISPRQPRPTVEIYPDPVIQPDPAQPGNPIDPNRLTD